MQGLRDEFLGLRIYEKCMQKFRTQCAETFRLELELETRTGNVEWLCSVAIARRVIYARPGVGNPRLCGGSL